MNFEMRNNDRRAFSATRKKFFYFVGTVLIGIGITGFLYESGTHSNFYGILLIGGIVYVVIGMIGKYYTKESNFITINSDKIEFKNTLQNEIEFFLQDLLDIVIESDKVDFITKNQRLASYNFSIYSEHEQKNLHKELNKIKTLLK